jgi:hypothetical protein
MADRDSRTRLTFPRISVSLNTGLVSLVFSTCMLAVWRSSPDQNSSSCASAPVLFPCTALHPFPTPFANADAFEDAAFELEEAVALAPLRDADAESLDLFAGGPCTSSSSSELTNGSSSAVLGLGLVSRMRFSRARRAASSCARSERNEFAVVVVVVFAVDPDALGPGFASDVVGWDDVLGLDCARLSSSSDEMTIGSSCRTAAFALDSARLCAIALRDHHVHCEHLKGIVRVTICANSFKSSSSLLLIVVVGGTETSREMSRSHLEDSNVT